MVLIMSVSLSGLGSLVKYTGYRSSCLLSGLVVAANTGIRLSMISLAGLSRVEQDISMELGRGFVVRESCLRAGRVEIPFTRFG